MYQWSPAPFSLWKQITNCPCLAPTLVCCFQPSMVFLCALVKWSHTFCLHALINTCSIRVSLYHHGQWGKGKTDNRDCQNMAAFSFSCFFSSFYIKYGLLKGNTLKFKRSRLLMGLFDCLILISLNTKTQLICNLTAMALCRICPQNKKQTWQLCAWLTIFLGEGRGQNLPPPPSIWSVYGVLLVLPNSEGFDQWGIDQSSNNPTLFLNRLEVISVLKLFYLSIQK